MFDTGEELPDPRQQLLSDLRRRISTISSGADTVGAPMVPGPSLPHSDKTRLGSGALKLDSGVTSGVASVGSAPLSSDGWDSDSFGLDGLGSNGLGSNDLGSAGLGSAGLLVPDPTNSGAGLGMGMPRNSEPGQPPTTAVARSGFSVDEPVNGVRVPLLGPASALRSARLTSGILPVPPALAEILPQGGLPKGGVVSLAGGRGITSLLLSLIAASAGSWSALVGMPTIGLLAATEFGVDLNRLALIPDPGPDVLQVLSVLADGVDLIAVAPPRGGFTAPARLRVLTGRLRQRGAVLLVSGGWPGADLVLRTQITAVSGIGKGHGRLRDRELTVEVRGRGAAVRQRSVTLLLQSTRTQVQVLPATRVPVAAPAPVAAGVVAEVG